MSQKSDQFEIFPYIHCFSNLKSTEDAFKRVKLPDVCPNQVMDNWSQFDFSMVAGEFVEVY